MKSDSRTRLAAAGFFGALMVAPCFADASARASGAHTAQRAPTPAVTSTPMPMIYVGIQYSRTGGSLQQAVQAYAPQQKGWNLQWSLLSNSTNLALAVDNGGFLYVTNDVYPQSVLVYPPGPAGPSGPQPVLTLDDRGYDPQSIAIGPKGTVFVGNLQTSVRAYRHGATKPYATYDTSAFQQFGPEFLAVDDVRGLYVVANAQLAYFTSPTSFSPIGFGATPPQDYAAAVAIDKNDNVVLDYINPPISPECSEAAVFVPGSWSTPTRSFPICQDPGVGHNWPVYNIALNRTNSVLYAAAWPKYGGIGEMAVFGYNYRTGQLVSGPWNPSVGSAGAVYIIGLATAPGTIP